MVRRLKRDRARRVRKLLPSARLVLAAVAALTSVAGVPQSFTDSSARPVIWFVPLDPIVRSWLGYAGSADYMDLFSPDAPWSNAAAQVKVFKVYTTLLTTFTLDERRRIFADLKRRGIALALEFGPLTRPRGSRCPLGEGFAEEGAAAKYARLIKEADGKLDYVAMDEPLYFAAMKADPQCRLSIREIAQNAVANLSAFRKEFPGVVIGDIEPVPGTNEPGWFEPYREWIDAYRAAAGSNLGFFHADIRWNHPAWRTSAADVSGLLAGHSIPFGIIYNSDSGGPNEWIGRARQHFVDYEAQGRRPPDHVVFQSWYADPRRVLPETDSRAFTYLINLYIAHRKLGAPVTASEPVAKASSTDRNAPLLQDAATIDIVNGVVPAGATTAMVAIRVHAECACRRAGDVALFGARYRTETERDRALTVDFRTGLAGWWVRGDADMRVEMVDGREALRIKASTAQSEIINSPAFPVQAGTNYAFEVFGKVPPESRGSGVVAIVFLANGKEITRHQVPM